MAVSQTPRSDIIARLREVIVEQGKMIAKFQRLNAEGADLLLRLQTHEENDNAGQPDFSRFKDMTSRLLAEFWKAPNRELSHEDIRQGVIFDEEANDETIWQVISRARKELTATHCPYEIKNIQKKGYRLTERNLTKTKKRK